MMKRLALCLLPLVGLSTALYTGCEDETTAASGGGTCLPTDASCPAVAVKSDCLALVDNTGKDKFVQRLSQLSVIKPDALKSELIYGIISKAVYVNLPATCNIEGDGTFSLITEFDKTAGVLRVGGAYPETDPTKGYCFVHDSANGIAPIEIPFNLAPDGTFATDAIPSVKVPVFTDITATRVVYLPLHETVLRNAKLSADQNCIGSFNTADLSPTLGCFADPPEIEYFINGGTLEGFIALEEADTVDVEEVGASLCVLLTGNSQEWGDGAMPISRCKREAGAIMFKGDWCSTTNSEGGCQDAMRLAADFAGSSASLRTTGWEARAEPAAQAAADGPCRPRRPARKMFEGS
jgi:hypothetical protein